MVCIIEVFKQIENEKDWEKKIKILTNSYDDNQKIVRVMLNYFNLKNNFINESLINSFLIVHKCKNKNNVWQEFRMNLRYISHYYKIKGFIVEKGFLKLIWNLNKTTSRKKQFELLKFFFINANDEESEWCCLYLTGNLAYKLKITEQMFLKSLEVYKNGNR
jgi:uncharacterized protein YktA (UPF0223 family)